MKRVKVTCFFTRNPAQVITHQSYNEKSLMYEITKTETQTNRPTPIYVYILGYTNAHYTRFK